MILYFKRDSVMVYFMAYYIVEVRVRSKRMDLRKFFTFLLPLHSITIYTPVLNIQNLFI